jgi:hypothetical protein
MAPPYSDEVHERDWIRDRIARLRDLLKFVADDRAVAAIEGLIAEAEVRLRKLETCR